MVDCYGILMIKFDAPMKDQDKGFNLSLVNEETISIKLKSWKSSQARLLREDQIEEQQLIGWTPVSFKGDTLKLKLEFSQPLNISLYRNQE